MNFSTAQRRDSVTELGRAMAESRWDVVLDALDPAIVAHVPAAGDLHGVDAVAGFLLETNAKTDDGEHIELLDAMVGETHAALYFRITATRAGREPLDNLTVHVARLGEERIEEVWFHNFDGPAVAAFWA